jgi:tRNA A37 N6-isopentenylltransferase MiaA
MKKTCIIIAGPTAVGKTAVSLNISRYFNTKIISADSRQCYKELNIGVAKPDATELETVFHYFIIDYRCDCFGFLFYLLRLSLILFYYFVTIYEIN